MVRTVLICGAGIAGPTLAFWLQRYGIAATVVERAPGLRGGGQSIDVRGAGREVIRRMGVEAAIRGATTGEQGVAFIDAKGRAYARFAATAFRGEGLTAELEILRDQMAAILYRCSADGSEYIFGDHVTELVPHAQGVDVRFAHGSPRTFDVVVGADGIGSRTRSMAFTPTELTRRFLGLYMAYFAIPRLAADDGWARWYLAPGGRSVFLRPDNTGTARAGLSFLAPPSGYESLGNASQRLVFQQRFADLGWQVPRVLEGMMAAEDFYMEAVGQVRLPRWSNDRVVLLGDAAYCPSPISGMGTSLALVGAYVLAGELAQGPDHRAALARYEAILRPYVERGQKLPMGAPHLLHPRSIWGRGVFRAAASLASRPLVTSLLGRVIQPKSEAMTLPDYPATCELEATAETPDATGQAPSDAPHRSVPLGLR